jgi:5-methylcytosine-specific restriction endonuclease McrA
MQDDRICDGGEAARPAVEGGILPAAERVRSSHSPTLKPSSKAQRRIAHERSQGRCAYCGRELTLGAKNWIVEHVVSRSRGGTDDPRNLVAACTLCNRRKTFHTPNEWREAIALRITEDLSHARALFVDYYAETAGENYLPLVARLGEIEALISAFTAGFFREDLIRIDTDDR